MNTPSPLPESTWQTLRNRPFAEIAIGEQASLQRLLTREDARLYSLLSGEGLPTADTEQPGDSLSASTLWSAALLANLLGTSLPGPGTTPRMLSLQFDAPLRPGDTLAVTLTVTDKDDATHEVTLSCEGKNQNGAPVLSGQVKVVAPSEPITLNRASLPDIRLAVETHAGLQRLLDHVRPMGRIRTAVVHPCNALSLTAALDARDAGLIEPILVGPTGKIQATAKAAGLDISGLRIEDAPHSHAASDRAVELARTQEAEALMKGSLHTDELLKAVLDRNAGLRTDRRLSHCFLMQTPAYPRPFIITDAAVNISPTLADKADIIRNAIDLAHAIGVNQPRVALLAAVETVNPGMPATLDAAALCKMADRGQIQGAVLDGPLAFDNAVSPSAAHIKGIVSPVAGKADILVVPDLESGNMLAKQLEYMGQASSAGIVLGARVPIVLTSRADGRDTRVASCAIAVLLAHWRRNRSTAT